MVFIVVENLVEIDALVSITSMFIRFCEFVLKCLFTPQNGVLGIRPLNEEVLRNPQSTSFGVMTSYDVYTVNHKKTWQFIFDYNFG